MIILKMFKPCVWFKGIDISETVTCVWSLSVPIYKKNKVLKSSEKRSLLSAYKLSTWQTTWLHQFCRNVILTTGGTIGCVMSNRCIAMQVTWQMVKPCERNIEWACLGCHTYSAIWCQCVCATNKNDTDPAQYLPSDMISHYVSPTPPAKIVVWAIV